MMSVYVKVFFLGWLLHVMVFYVLQLRCPNKNCVTCNSLTGRGKCTDSNVVYGFGCALGNYYKEKIGQYDGETYRPTHERSGYTTDQQEIPRQNLINSKVQTTRKTLCGISP